MPVLAAIEWRAGEIDTRALHAALM
jgi:hypothetical protein